MRKYVTVCIAVIFYALPMNAEIQTGLMKSIVSNEEMYLLVNKVVVPCKPFGIVPLESLGKKSGQSTECGRELKLFFQNHPHAYNFAREHVYKEQTYHIEFLKEGCVLYGNGPETYSEMLLREGLAVIEKTFSDPEWNWKLKRAFQGAERMKTGYHDSAAKNLCIEDVQ